jgi:hypothetical protein
MGPVLWRMAEPVTRDVVLMGLRLGLSRQAIENGNRPSALSGLGDDILLERSGVPVMIRMDARTDQVREIIQFSGISASSEADMERDAILRFGFGWELKDLKRITDNSSISKKVWTSEDGRVRLEFHPSTQPDESASLHLITVD